MGNVPKRNTEFIDNPIGRDRPIYGNEELPPPTPTPSVSSGYIPPSPTPSSSPIPPTPTPTFVCNCYSFSAFNNGENTAIVQYTNCEYGTSVFTIDPGYGNSFCGCLGTIDTSGNRDVVITNYGSCVSPTPTPSFTPTPTQSDPFTP